MGQQFSRPGLDVSAWTVGALAQELVDEAVLKGSTGNFIIRTSTRRSDLFVLTVNDHGTALHYPFTQERGSSFNFAGHRYNSILDLVRHVQEEGLPGQKTQAYGGGGGNSAIFLTTSVAHLLRHESQAAAGGSSSSSSGSGSGASALSSSSSSSAAAAAAVVGAGSARRTDSARRPSSSTLSTAATTTATRDPGGGNGSNVYMGGTSSPHSMVCPGYVGLLGRNEASSILRAAGPGSFLLRQSRKAGVYQLMCADASSQVSQWSVLKDSQGYFRLGNKPFETLDALMRTVIGCGLRSERGDKISLTRPMEPPRRRGVMSRITGKVSVVTRSRNASSSSSAPAGPTGNDDSSVKRDSGGASTSTRNNTSMNMSMGTGQNSASNSTTTGSIKATAASRPRLRSAGNAGIEKKSAPPNTTTGSSAGAASSHEGEPWYAGQIGRQTAEKLVLGAGQGDYLVYQSTSDNDIFSLAIHDRGTVVRHVIRRKGSTFILGRRGYASLATVVELASRKPMHTKSGVVSLASPIAQSRGVSSNTHPKSNTATATDTTSENAVLGRRQTTRIAPRAAAAAGKVARSSSAATDGITRASAVRRSMYNVDMLSLLGPLDEEGFKKIGRKATLPEQLPEHARGRRLNRFFDILPNPLTRVRLKKLDFDPTLEYINASYIRGYGGRRAREYIAAQAPLNTGTYNFVRMIYEKRLAAILMCTGLIEKNKRKCARYWPELVGGADGKNDLTFYNLHVRKISEERRKGYLMAKCEIRLDGAAGVHTFMHFWYDTWPDHGVPLDSDGRIDTSAVLDLLADVKQYRRHADAAESPLLVHCSAGVGRTGTLIVIDFVCDALRTGEPVDVRDVVAELREDRMSLIQHPSQYAFAYQGAVLYARRYGSSSTAGENGGGGHGDGGGGDPIYGVAADPNTIKRMTISGDWRLVSEGDDGVKLFEMDAHKALEGAGVQDEEEEAEEGITEVVEDETDAAVATGVPLLSEEIIEEDIPGRRVGEYSSRSTGGGGDGGAVQLSSKRMPPPPPSSSSSGPQQPAARRRPVTEEPWFRSNFSRAQINEALCDAPDGTFLVRPSSRPGHFALSLKHGRVRGGIVNFLIVPVNEGGGSVRYKMGQSGTKLFDSLIELIEDTRRRGLPSSSGGPKISLIDFKGGNSTTEGDGGEEEC